MLILVVASLLHNTVKKDFVKITHSELMDCVENKINHAQVMESIVYLLLLVSKHFMKELVQLTLMKNPVSGTIINVVREVVVMHLPHY